jgi:hypothetical protein
MDEELHKPVEAELPPPVDEAREKRRAKAREEMAQLMAAAIGGPLAQLGGMFGPEMVINGLLDLACGMAATSFEEHLTQGYLTKMAVRVNDTDWRRHRARMFQAKVGLGVVKPGENRSEGGIVLPK